MQKNNSGKGTSYEYYIEEGFYLLAGPYEYGNSTHTGMLERVIKDMQRGKIEYRLTKDNRGRTLVERKGMILPKRKS